MNQTPPELLPILRLLHETVDRTTDAEIARLEAARLEKHEEAERFLMSLLQAATAPPASNGKLPFRPSTAENGNGNSRKTPFALKETIQTIIAAAPDDADIDQRSLYQRLTAEYPELRERIEGHLRGQIVGVLKKLADEDYIRIVKRGAGGSPNVYRKAESRESAVGLRGI